MHPGPGTKDIPSYTALVASVDGHVSKYVAVTSLQTGRVEIIEDLETMCKVQAHVSDSSFVPI